MSEAAQQTYQSFGRHQEAQVTVQDSMHTPSEAVAEKIMERFVNTELLTSELAAEILVKVSNGRMQPADWKLTFEKAVGLHKAG